ncbi:MAG TPA: ABC transporter permease [Spirochaetales bacterium]|nr:ABC transporter permease [Spirochaetales bacterium]
MMSFFRKVLYFILFLALWEAAVALLGIKEFILPSPLKTLSHIFVPQLAAKYKWPLHIQATLLEILASFFITALAGNLLALLITWSGFLKKIVTPIIVFFNSLPKIALAPLFLLWFGYGLLPNTLIAVLVAFFPIVINTSTGLETVEEDLLDLVRYLGASKWQMFVKIRIPNALPYIFSGFKIAATMCVVGSIVGEFIASDKGLGYLLKDAQAFIDTPTMFACLILISILGILLFGAISLLESKVLFWMPNVSDRSAV